MHVYFHAYTEKTCFQKGQSFSYPKRPTVDIYFQRLIFSMCLLSHSSELQILPGQLSQRAHLYMWTVARLESGISFSNIVR